VNSLGGANWLATVTLNLGACPLTELRGPSGPVGAIALGVGLSAYKTDISDFSLNRTTGKIVIRTVRGEPYQFPTHPWGGHSQATKVRVVYWAGYNGDPTQGSVTTQPDLAEACVEIARGLLDARAISGAYSQVVLGNSSYSSDEPFRISPLAADKLSRYVDRRF
jgi:hypothetical protein